ncbi:hypothetical protein EB796_024729 [Bugula neritina]|uniref:Uncharacterized protein n=1 Tax=Bugula neritina TaxID=10212 RepID=A0A7J7ITS3_BUGNE|nr:hypothetical protein EB796_024729 [Bugula neritina]
MVLYFTDSDSLPGHVDLFALGDRFLPRILSYAFGIHVLLTFTINGLSYALAGSQSYSDVFSITNTIVVLPFFCWILNLLAVFGRRLVDPFVSILTLFKGTLLLIVVVIAFIVGSTIQKEITNDFHYIADSFLTATVALGGTFLTMPYMFTKISFSEPDVRYYRLAITLGMVTCYVLETLWCWAVLDVVPQVDACLSIDYTNTSTTGCLPPGYTLQSAEENGEISTVPFSRVLDDSYPMYSWVGTVISVFIMISITVSYTFNSTVLCQTVEGVVSSVWRISWNRCDFKLASSEVIVAIAANFFLMTVIFVVALFNPQSFVIIVSKAMSIANNFGVGFYISIMMWRCTGKNFQYLEIPLPLSKFQVKLQYLVSVFFMLATVWGVVSWILESI